MSEELHQRDLINNPDKIGKWDFRNIGASSLNALKNAGIIPKKDYKNFERRKPDGIITSTKEVIAIIENKAVSKFKTKKQKDDAFNQGLDVAQILNAKILILTDTVDTIWINALNGEEILDEKGRLLKTHFNHKDADLEKLIEQIIDSIDKTNSQLLEPRLKDPTRLAKSIWQDLWMAAGATPENCLYSFVELFIFKYLSDLDVLKDHLSYDFLMKMFENQNEEVVLEYYADQIRKYIKTNLFPISTRDNTTIINGTIFVSKDEKAVEGYGTVFKKILTKFGNEKDGGGELKNIDKDFKSKLFETFLKESISKKNWGQYFTPLKVVRAIVKMAESDIKPDITICDPACGVGKFLLEPLLVNNNIEDFYQVKNGKLESRIKLIGIDKGFDKEEQKTIILAKANMLIYLSDVIRKHSDITKQFAEVFNNSFELKTKNILGTLRDVSHERTIDLILTNPPYVTSGSSNLKEEIIKSGLQKHYKINAMGVEGLFMEWIIRALKPGGKAFVVVPDGIFNRQNDKNLRQYILDECIIDGIISLPLKTFFTTPKKTYILCITKKKNKLEKQTDPVFTYLVSEMGESRDIYRFDIEQNDLEEATNQFNLFKGAKKYYKSIENRCKIQPITNFGSETHWSIERWWTKEEQIELGVIEEDKTTRFEEFPDIIEEVANNILSFKEEILQLNEKKKTKIDFKTFKIEDLFTIKRGNSKFIKKYIDLNAGEFALFSGNTSGEFARINSFDYEIPCLSWAIDGFAGYMMNHNIPFSATSHRGVLIPKNNNLNLEYLKYITEPVFRKNRKGRGSEDGKNEYTALPPFMIKNLEIEIPIKKNGDIDLDFQNNRVEKILEVGQVKSKIIEYKKQIEELSIIVDDTFKSKLFSINELFDIKSGNSKITQEYLNSNKGEYVVYSANTKQNGVFGYINSFDYDIECIQLTTNGVYAGTFFYREKHKFSMNGDARLLIKKNNNLDYYYLLTELKKAFLLYKFNWENKPTIEKMKPIKIKIPIDLNGGFDLEGQREIAEKYRKIEQIKKSISQELDKIVNIEIDYE